VLREGQEGTSVVEIERAIRRQCPDAVLWFPAVTEAGMVDERSPFASYVFVRPPVPSLLSRVWCIARILSEPMAERELLNSIKGLPPLGAGDRVKIISGPYRALEGRLENSNRDQCRVAITLESGVRRITVPRVDVEVCG
jgi:hypothetical protein